MYPLIEPFFVHLVSSLLYFKHLLSSVLFFFFVVLVNKLALVPLSRKEGERGSLVQVGRLRLVSSCSATQPRWPHQMTVSEVWHMVLHISLLHVYFNAYMHNHLCEKFGKKCIFERYWKATPTAGWQTSSVQWKEQQTCCAAYNCMCSSHPLCYSVPLICTALICMLYTLSLETYSVV